MVEHRFAAAVREATSASLVAVRADSANSQCAILHPSQHGRHGGLRFKRGRRLPTPLGCGQALGEAERRNFDSRSLGRLVDAQRFRRHRYALHTVGDLLKCDVASRVGRAVVRFDVDREGREAAVVGGP